MIYFQEGNLDYELEQAETSLKFLTSFVILGKILGCFNMTKRGLIIVPPKKKKEKIVPPIKRAMQRVFSFMYIVLSIKIKWCGKTDTIELSSTTVYSVHHSLLWNFLCLKCIIMHSIFSQRWIYYATIPYFIKSWVSLFLEHQIVIVFCSIQFGKCYNTDSVRY